MEPDFPYIFIHSKNSKNLHNNIYCEYLCIYSILYLSINISKVSAPTLVIPFLQEVQSSKIGFSFPEKSILGEKWLG